MSKSEGTGVKISNIKEKFKNIDLKMFLVIFITLVIPSIYITVRINFISNIPNEWGFNIASQLQWINIMIEVLQEALIFPLFFLIGKTIHSKEKTREKIVTSLTIIFVIITLVALILGISANALANFMNQSEELVPATVKYIRLELVGIVFANLVKFLIVVLIEKSRYRAIILILAIQTILTIILDYLFLNQLNIGVNAIAYTNMIVQSTLFMLMLVIVFKMFEIKPKKFLSYINFNSVKEWWKQGSLSALESFVRNAVFAVMILKIVNEVGESGNFWVMMSFMWGWILLPVIALGDVIKNESSQDIKNISKNFKGYMILTTLLVIVWILLIPLYKPFLDNILGLDGDNLMKVYSLSLISLGFYIAFAYNNVIDSICYGIGKVNLLLYQSLIINLIYYGIMFILYKQEIFVPTLNSIAVMFGIGMLLDSIVTFIMFKFYIKKKGIKI